MVICGTLGVIGGVVTQIYLVDIDDVIYEVVDIEQDDSKLLL